ncbi:unnamed protein product [Protopolystoma xenopodis]|uniref:Uncharacterized protein n=1 Tax=Protopolystoma xenopodis TaxID=117903 RepID=A0A3S5CDS7_9PLAT|nr:unnamed protein product [Protopolystoma xenopodis]
MRASSGTCISPGPDDQNSLLRSTGWGLCSSIGTISHCQTPLFVTSTSAAPIATSSSSNLAAAASSLSVGGKMLTRLLNSLGTSSSGEMIPHSHIPTHSADSPAPGSMTEACTMVAPSSVSGTAAIDAIGSGGGLGSDSTFSIAVSAPAPLTTITPTSNITTTIYCNTNVSGVNTTLLPGLAMANVCNLGNEGGDTDGIPSSDFTGPWDSSHDEVMGQAKLNTTTYDQMQVTSITEVSAASTSVITSFGSSSINTTVTFSSGAPLITSSSSSAALASTTTPSLTATTRPIHTSCQQSHLTAFLSNPTFAQLKTTSPMALVVLMMSDPE